MAVNTKNTKFLFLKSTSIPSYISTGKADVNDFIFVKDTGALLVVNKDGTTTTISNPDALKYEIVSTLPTSNISTNTIYYMKKPGTDIYYQYIYSLGVWEIVGTSGIPVATTTEAGIVKPDGVTIVVDVNGVISVKKEGLDTYMQDNINDYIDDYMNSGDKDLNDSDIDGLF